MEESPFAGNLDFSPLSPFSVQLRDEEYEETINFLYVHSPVAMRDPSDSLLSTPDSVDLPAMPSPPTTTPFIRTHLSHADVSTYLAATPGSHACTPASSRSCRFTRDGSAARLCFSIATPLFDSPVLPSKPSPSCTQTPFLSPDCGLLFTSSKATRLRRSAMRNADHTPYSSRRRGGGSVMSSKGPTQRISQLTSNLRLGASPATPTFPSPPVSTTLLEYRASSGLATVLHTPLAALVPATRGRASCVPSKLRSVVKSISREQAPTAVIGTTWDSPVLTIPGMASPPRSTAVLRAKAVSDVTPSKRTRAAKHSTPTPMKETIGAKKKSQRKAAGESTPTAAKRTTRTPQRKAKATACTPTQANPGVSTELTASGRPLTRLRARELGNKENGVAAV